ncbi:hypothetical protein DVS28_a2908 [Euzebya pacifica]|uniref:Uncharacterized protein n=1 Tax=Euzebya pacifica TaxID=1608957 RepID=A0A346XZE0_9ACTN|nr:hypothetical protein [Euzebya pacifica]AXV07587.1 hypothetical protein DVS28_a2908 [Euzebya pacifica]
MADSAEHPAHTLDTPSARQVELHRCAWLLRNVLVVLTGPFMAVSMLAVARHGIQTPSDLWWGLVLPVLSALSVHRDVRWRARYGDHRKWWTHYLEGGVEREQASQEATAERVRTEWPRIAELLEASKDLPEVAAELVDGHRHELVRAAEDTLELFDRAGRGREEAARYRRAQADLEEAIEEFAGLVADARALAVARATVALREIGDARLRARALLHVEHVTLIDDTVPAERFDGPSRQVVSTS